MSDSCPHCGSDNARFVPGHAARADEPAADDGWECEFCSTWWAAEFNPITEAAEYHADDKFDRMREEGF